MKEGLQRNLPCLADKAVVQGELSTNTIVSSSNVAGEAGLRPALFSLPTHPAGRCMAPAAPALRSLLRPHLCPPTCSTLCSARGLLGVQGRRHPRQDDRARRTAHTHADGQHLLLPHVLSRRHPTAPRTWRCKNPTQLVNANSASRLGLRSLSFATSCLTAAHQLLTKT